MQTFFRKISFVRKFILKFEKTIRPLQLMNKKNADSKWSQGAKESFEKIKTTTSNALVLISPNFNKDFFLCTFTSDISISTMLNVQVNQP
jgi:hypothetical protein